MRILGLFLFSILIIGSSNSRKACKIERIFKFGPGYEFCGVYCDGEEAYMCRTKKNGFCKILSKCIADAKKNGTVIKTYVPSKRVRK